MIKSLWNTVGPAQGSHHCFILKIKEQVVTLRSLCSVCMAPEPFVFFG